MIWAILGQEVHVRIWWRSPSFYGHYTMVLSMYVPTRIQLEEVTIIISLVHTKTNVWNSQCRVAGTIYIQ